MGYVKRREHEKPEPPSCIRMLEWEREEPGKSVGRTEDNLLGHTIGFFRHIYDLENPQNTGRIFAVNTLRLGLIKDRIIIALAIELRSI
jgi:hypothetical protein